jgi:hypothetical protein
MNVCSTLVSCHVIALQLAIEMNAKRFLIAPRRYGLVAMLDYMLLGRGELVLDSGYMGLGDRSGQLSVLDSDSKDGIARSDSTREEKIWA